MYSISGESVPGWKKGAVPVVSYVSSMSRSL
jgi:hypothetical protein